MLRIPARIEKVYTGAPLELLECMSGAQFHVVRQAVATMLVAH